MKPGLYEQNGSKSSPILSKKPAKSKNDNSYQVLNLQGQRSTNIKLLEKKEFRLPFQSTQYTKIKLPISSLRRAGVSAYSGEYTWSLLELILNHFRHVETLVKNLKYMEEPTYLDAMVPFDAIQDIITGHLHLSPQKALKEQRNTIMLRSADFLERAEAHRNDQKLSPSAKYRALSTYWVYIMLESIFQDTNQVAPSSQAYAYSFLYPYTDDIMDMSTIKADDGVELENTSQVKNELGRNILYKLKTGQHPECFALRGSTPGLEQELRIYDLIDDTLSIDSGESEVNSCLRDAMCSINLAQIASMQQQAEFYDINMFVKSMSKQQKKKIFDITVNKGAASILPIAYLNNTVITKEQAELAATFGYLLQFINDIEGLHEDLTEKNLTPALLTFIKHGCLDRFIERSLKAIDSIDRHIATKFSTLSGDRIHSFLMMFRLRLLITTALCHERGCERGIKKGCVQECTRRPILSPSYVKKLQKKLKLPLSVLAYIAKLEHEAFGGTLPSTHCCDCHKNSNFQCKKQQILPPSLMRDFIVKKSEELLRTKL